VRFDIVILPCLLNYTMNLRLLLVITLLLSLSSYSQKTPLSADDILKEAYGQAAKQNKNVFVIFHASWCVWCHRMDSSMNDKACRKFFEDNYVIRHLTVDESKDKQNLQNPGADDLRKKYYGDGQGIPFWLIFDKDGNLLADSKMRADGANPETGDNTGCPASEKEVTYFLRVLEQTSKINQQQQEVIRKRFRQNEH
jgi:thiol-disulfide isomerase/thioredoxin